MRILKKNLMAALWIAISQRRKEERESGYTGDSILVGGWKENLNALENGEFLTIED